MCGGFDTGSVFAGSWFVTGCESFSQEQFISTAAHKDNGPFHTAAVLTCSEQKQHIDSVSPEWNRTLMSHGTSVSWLL